MTATAPRINVSRTTPPSREWSEFLFVPDLLFAVATVLAWWLLDPDRGLAVLSVIAMVFAVSNALRRGGPFLLPSSVFFMAAGVFVGGGGYYLGRVDYDVATIDVRNAAALALLSTIGVSIVVLSCSVQWRLKWHEMDRGEAAVASSFQPPREFVLRATALVVLSQVPPVGKFLGPIAQALGLTGILMLALVGSTRRVRLRWTGDLVLVAVAVIAPLFWFYAEFAGSGRLMIAGLFIASFMGWNMVRPQRMQKVAIILMIPVFLVAAGMDRTGRGSNENSSTASVVADGDGLGSVYGPLATFAQLIEPMSPEEEMLIGPRYGGTFFNTLILPIPRTMWEDKPVGFGRELVYALEVTGVGENHSMAALYQGEWYANFGYVGLAMLVPITGLALAAFDRVHNRIVVQQMATARLWWAAVALLCGVSSLADLYWVGSFMWFARGGLALVLALVVARMSQRRVRNTRRVRRAGQGRRSVQPHSTAQRGLEAEPPGRSSSPIRRGTFGT